MQRWHRNAAVCAARRRDDERVSPSNSTGAAWAWTGVGAQRRRAAALLPLLSRSPAAQVCHGGGGAAPAASTVMPRRFLVRAALSFVTGAAVGGLFGRAGAGLGCGVAVAEEVEGAELRHACLVS